MTLIDLTGKRFGKLTVIGRTNSHSGTHVYWHCKYDCDEEIDVRSQHLREGKINSCGCLRGERHSMRFSRLYSIYTNIKTRCYNSNAINYNDYGGRGIFVCEEWKNSFMAFATWANENGYTDKLTLDRIDNNGNYEPNNCRWANRITQANNKRCNVRYKYKGEEHTIGEWSRILPISRKAVYQRLERGKDVMDLFVKAEKEEAAE